MTRRTTWIVVVGLLLSLGLVASASARRPASAAERAAIVHGLPKSYRDGIARAPAGCVTLVVRVSANGRFAEVTPRFSARAACVRFGSDGFFLLRRTTVGWKTIFKGSDQPSCDLGVPVDLISCAGDH